MHYTDAIAQLRALGFTANKIGKMLFISHKDQPHFKARYPINPDNGLMPSELQVFLDSLKPKPTLADFQPGTRFRHKTADLIWIVTENFGNRVTAVATRDVTNPDEWEIVK